MQVIRKAMSMAKDEALIDQDNDDEVENLLKRSVLRLDWLNVSKIENLDAFTHIRELYLQHNLIAVIENLEFHLNLSFLALAHNRITRIENINRLPHLKFLDVSYNQIEELDLDELPQSLLVLRVTGNPWADSRDNYAQICFDHLPNLLQCDGYRRNDPARLSPTHLHSDRHAELMEEHKLEEQESRDEVKKKKEAMSHLHTARVKTLNETLDVTKSAIVERSMERMREKRKKLQEETQNHLNEAATHLQQMHLQHASWRKEQLQAHQA
ncbi:leucine-rich repeat-containing protein 46 isoform X1 [Thraustotheca clavata]|uniref:Leucine-rich repeat-containing protein 46 isoform X1 n=1 Tax=Thraustotheca clavata TaxID=74557 RepID=A0A1W0ACD8_9STRA|nr:leucine-rich repeat-containing protein 46 isoform X1 [Thraustotheca clavata]